MGLYEIVFVPLETGSYNKWANDYLKNVKEMLLRKYME